MGMRDWQRQFLLFAGVGLVATATHYLVLFLCVHYLGAHPVLGSAAGFATSVLLNYALNHRFTFVSRLAHRRTIPRFAAVVGVGLALNSLLMWLGVEVLAVHYLLAQAGASALVLVWNFVASRRWAFYDSVAPPPPTAGR